MILVNIIGNYKGNNTGYGTHIRNYWNSIKKLENMNYMFNFIDYVDVDEYMVNIEKAKKHVSVNILICSGDRYDILEPFHGIKIIYTVFESTRLPDNWVVSLNRCDYVFTASKWGREVMIKNGVVVKVYVVPEGVNPVVYNPWGGRIKQIVEGGRFRFLVVGKYEERKSYIEIFNAFRNNFGDDEGVELYIKANSFVDQDANNELNNVLKLMNLKNIKVIGGNIDEDIMAGIYRSCHCFVFPTKAEGWGLPLIEAISSGIPVITTYYSGHTEFLSVCRENIAEISHKLDKITAKDFFKWGYKFEDGEGGYWGYVDVGELGRVMCEVRERYGEWEERGLVASREIQRNFSWDNSAYLTLSIINDFSLRGVL